jgi:RNA polymerase sigma factor (sigma-70 family)
MSELRRADSVVMGDAARLDIPAPARALRSRRLLRLAGDDRLVQQIQRGSEAAFEVAFERYAPPVLSFCRHMLGSLEEAEDAVQHTFAAAYGDLQRGDREIILKPWLFTIARNRCVSVLRARRELPLEQPEAATAGLAEQAEQRAELRQLVADVRDLPDEQRAALLLAEVGGLAHTEIASVLDCEVPRVKALVYRARSSLVARREARELPCEEIREQLANLRGGSLRRTELRLHLRECTGCRDFREQVRRQRKMLSMALPVAPTLGLKTSVLAAVGLSGGAAGGGAAAGGAAVVGGATVAKVAAVAVIAAGGVAGGAAVVEHERHAEPAPAAQSTDGAKAHFGGPAVPGGSSAATPAEPTGAAGSERSRGRPQVGKRSTHVKERTALGRPVREQHSRGNGRGPIETPPKSTPVRRGPPEAKVKPAKPVKPIKPVKPDKPVAEPQARSGHGQNRGETVKPVPKGKAQDL